MSLIYDLLCDAGILTRKQDAPLTVSDPAGNPVPIYTAEQADDMYSAWLSVIESVGSAVSDLPERLAFAMQRPSPVYDVPSDQIHLRTVRWGSGSTATQPLAMAMKDRTAVTLIVPNKATALLITDGHQPLSDLDGFLLDPAAQGAQGATANFAGTILRLPTRAALSATPVVATGDGISTYVSVIEEHITPTSQTHIS